MSSKAADGATNGKNGHNEQDKKSEASELSETSDIEPIDMEDGVGSDEEEKQQSWCLQISIDSSKLIS